METRSNVDSKKWPDASQVVFGVKSLEVTLRNNRESQLGGFRQTYPDCRNGNQAKI